MWTVRSDQQASGHLDRNKMVAMNFNDWRRQCARKKNWRISRVLICFVFICFCYSKVAALKMKNCVKRVGSWATLENIRTLTKTEIKYKQEETKSTDVSGIYTRVCLFGHFLPLIKTQTQMCCRRVWRMCGWMKICIINPYSFIYGCVI